MQSSTQLMEASTRLVQVSASTRTDMSQTKADIADIKNDIETLRQSVRDLVVASQAQQQSIERIALAAETQSAQLRNQREDIALLAQTAARQQQMLETLLQRG